MQTRLRHSEVKMMLQRYAHSVSRDRVVAADYMLSAILSHAQDENGPGADWVGVQIKTGS